MSLDTLPVHYVTITMFKLLVKTDSIKFRYTGGWEKFASDYGYDEAPISGLVPLTSMSKHDLDSLISEVASNGLIPGEDFAVADQSVGTLKQCGGIEIRKLECGDGPFGEWVAFISPSTDT